MLQGSNTYHYVVAALAKSGYGDQGITSARFTGSMSKSGCEIHLVTFLDPETGEQDEGYVYVKDGKGDF
jgi:hypothetical protein